MSRVERAFGELAKRSGKTLIPYITAGYPDVETTVDILRGIDPARCACVELGIPFSDPIADGPVIQTSFSRALEAGFRLDALLTALRAAKEEIRVPLAAMVSYSIVFRRGPRAFVAALVNAGVDALIVPDLSLEEADEFAATARDAGSGLVMIAAPTTQPSRLSRITALSSPFVYYQCVAGVTGERGGLPADLATRVSAIRSAAGKPVCVGFGIGNAAQVADVCRIADGAIVGSAIVRRMNDAADRGLRGGAFAGEVSAFISELSRGVN